MRERLLLELTTTLGAGVASDDALDAALQIVLRELRVERGAFFVVGEDGGLALRAARGLPTGTPPATTIVAPRDDITAVGPGDEAHDRHGLELLVKLQRRGRTIAILGLGPREAGQPYGAEERTFLQSVAACAASPIENGLLYDELRRVHQKLSGTRFGLHNLIDIGRDLTGSSAEEAIQNLTVTAAMGHFVVSRCALYLCGPRGLTLAHGRGVRPDAEAGPIPPEDTRHALEGLSRPLPVAELPDGPLRGLLQRARLVLAVPLAAGARVEGVIAIGERASGMPFSSEDREVAQALARQALAALENARLQRVREEKLRQDRELQIAREIQASLLPQRPPEITGFEVAAESRPCYEVGGDSYDWIPLEAERIALVIADVAGKGTPASLLMASVHAFVHAIAGTATPALVIERLNRFLLARTQTSRFVTLFYAELDAATRRLVYVNAGHVPPYRVARDGTLSRLLEGGPAPGLLAEASYDVGELKLEPGELIAMVTDGVTEAMSPDEREFGDDGVCEVLRAIRGASAPAVLLGLVSAANAWAGGGGVSDDLTALVLKAR